MHSILQQTTKVIMTANHSINHLLERAGGLNDICIFSARLLMGLFFVYFGMDKLLLPLVLVIEIGGGIALMLGWRLRMVAGILASFTLLTTLIFHSDFSVQVQLILFMKNLAILAGLLLMVGCSPANSANSGPKQGKRKS
jgi:uncharacterized membrane protein YphA (DoxX/SURF4 family)